MKKRTPQSDDRLLWLQATKDFPVVYKEVFKNILSCFRQTLSEVNLLRSPYGTKMNKNIITEM